MRNPGRRHWYHCTEEFRGPRWVAERLIPKYAGPSEGAVPRLCVAESVAQCFAARLFSCLDVHVYRTESERRSLPPVNVWDSVITQERWLVPPVPMVLVETIPAHKVWEASGRSYSAIEDWVKSGSGDFKPTKVFRLRTYYDAIKGLGPKYYRPWERRFVEKMIEVFKAREEPEWEQMTV